MNKTQQEEIEELKEMLGNLEPLKAECEKFQDETEKLSDLIWTCKSQLKRKASWLDVAIADAKTRYYVASLTSPFYGVR